MSEVEDVRGVRLLHPLVHGPAFVEFRRISADPVIFQRPQD